jgi:hypothetical protein
MLLLLVSLLLLPPAMLAESEFYPAENVDVISRSASIPGNTSRAVVITQTGGISPVKSMSVKIYENEGDYKMVNVEYATLFHTGDFYLAKRRADYDSFEQLWLELKRNRALFLIDTPPGKSDESPVFHVYMKESNTVNDFKVIEPETLEDERYLRIIGTLEAFWKEELQLQ